MKDGGSHAIVFKSHGNQLLLQWCKNIMVSYVCVFIALGTLKYMDIQWVNYTCYKKKGLILQNGVFQVRFVRWWKRLWMIGKKLEKHVELWSECLDMSLKNKWCKFNGHVMFHKKEYWKGCDDINILI